MHKESGKSTYDEPTTETYIPKGWTEPDPPACLFDSNGNLLSPRSIRRNEQDTVSEPSEASSGSDSEDERWKQVGEALSDSDSDKDNDNDEEKKETNVDDAVAG